MILNIGCKKEPEVEPKIKRWFDIEVIKGNVGVQYHINNTIYLQPLEPGMKPIFNPDKIPAVVRTFCIDKVCEYEVNGKTFYDHAIFYYEDFQ